MKAVILAGGLGTRLAEETHLTPKPMIEIGGRPILWHIMKIYSHFGIDEFVICAGYRGYKIKEYFANYFLHMSDVTIDLRDNSVEVHEKRSEPWKVTIIDTGENTLTGGRLKRVQDYVGNETFCFTYGDGLADVDVARLVEFHRSQGKLVTLTAVQPPGRYGTLGFDPANPDLVADFMEKPAGDGGWINGGFFVLEPDVFSRIEGDMVSWEGAPMTCFAEEGQLAAYRHSGFWRAMDTLRDKQLLESLWQSPAPPWKLWHG
jgi:glucose-1-phosphate cytidylyltransferase